MTEDDTGATAHDPRVVTLVAASRTIDVDSLDVPRLVKVAHSERRRRRMVLTTVITAVVIAIGSVAAIAHHASSTTKFEAADQPQASFERAFPEPPPGHKWVGMHEIVVAVPSDWPVSAAACSLGAQAQVRIVVDSITGSCSEQVGTVDVRFSALNEDASTQRSPLRCEQSEPPSCAAAVAVNDADIEVLVRSSGDAAAANIDKILDSVMVLPEGWTTVPAGGEDDEAQREAVLLADGFQVNSQIPATASGDVRSNPPVGTPVPVGTSITILPAD